MKFLNTFICCLFLFISYTNAQGDGIPLTVGSSSGTIILNPGSNLRFTLDYTDLAPTTSDNALLVDVEVIGANGGNDYDCSNAAYATRFTTVSGLDFEFLQIQALVVPTHPADFSIVGSACEGHLYYFLPVLDDLTNIYDIDFDWFEANQIQVVVTVSELSLTSATSISAGTEIDFTTLTPGEFRPYIINPSGGSLDVFSMTIAAAGNFDQLFAAVPRGSNTMGDATAIATGTFTGGCIALDFVDPNGPYGGPVATASYYGNSQCYQNTGFNSTTFNSEWTPIQNSFTQCPVQDDSYYLFAYASASYTSGPTNDLLPPPSLPWDNLVYSTSTVSIDLDLSPSTSMSGSVTNLDNTAPALVRLQFNPSVDLPAVGTLFDITFTITGHGTTPISVSTVTEGRSFDYFESCGAGFAPPGTTCNPTTHVHRIYDLGDDVRLETSYYILLEIQNLDISTISSLSVAASINNLGTGEVLPTGSGLAMNTWYSYAFVPGRGSSHGTGSQPDPFNFGFTGPRDITVQFSHAALSANQRVAVHMSSSSCNYFEANGPVVGRGAPFISDSERATEYLTDDRGFWGNRDTNDLQEGTDPDYFAHGFAGDRLQDNCNNYVYIVPACSTAANTYLTWSTGDFDNQQSVDFSLRLEIISVNPTALTQGVASSNFDFGRTTTGPFSFTFTTPTSSTPETQVLRFIGYPDPADFDSDPEDARFNYQMYASGGTDEECARSNIFVRANSLFATDFGGGDEMGPFDCSPVANSGYTVDMHYTGNHDETFGGPYKGHLVKWEWQTNLAVGTGTPPVLTADNSNPSVSVTIPAGEFERAFRVDVVDPTLSPRHIPSLLATSAVANNNDYNTASVSFLTDFDGFSTCGSIYNGRQSVEFQNGSENNFDDDDGSSFVPRYPQGDDGPPVASATAPRFDDQLVITPNQANRWYVPATVCQDGAYSFWALVRRETASQEANPSDDADIVMTFTWNQTPISGLSMYNLTNTVEQTFGMDIRESTATPVVLKTDCPQTMKFIATWAIPPTYIPLPIQYRFSFGEPHFESGFFSMPIDDSILTGSVTSACAGNLANAGDGPPTLWTDPLISGAFVYSQGNATGGPTDVFVGDIGGLAIDVWRPEPFVAPQTFLLWPDLNLDPSTALTANFALAGSGLDLARPYVGTDSPSCNTVVPPGTLIEDLQARVDPLVGFLPYEQALGPLIEEQLGQLATQTGFPQACQDIFTQYICTQYLSPVDENGHRLDRLCNCTALMTACPELLSDTGMTVSEFCAIIGTSEGRCAPDYFTPSLPAPTCSINQVPCSDSICFNGGTCVTSTLCDCVGPFSGALCDTCNYPCQNGGVPNASCDGCDCPTGLLGGAGEDCSLLDCAGTCTTGGNTFCWQNGDFPAPEPTGPQCICDPGNPVFPCEDPCSGNGQVNTADPTNHFCDCNFGFSGDSCELECAVEECNGNGQCINPNVPNSGCFCFGGYTGSTCQFCTSTSCSGNGVCNGVTNTCDCDSGWSGSGCNIPVCTPACELEEFCWLPDECRCRPGFIEIPANSGNCSAVVPPRTWGDPHFVTLDEAQYTYNGKGEFTLLQSVNSGLIDELNFQVRMEPCEEGSPGTCITALAFPIGDEIVTIVAPLDGTNSLNVRVSNATGLVAELVGGDFPYVTFAGVEIDSFLANAQKRVFQARVANNTCEVTFAKELGFASVFFKLSDDYLTKTQGLYGYWDADDGTNDFLLANGTTLIDPSANEIYLDFGESWRVDPGNSLFYRKPAEPSATDVNDQTNFTPVIELDQSNTALVDEAVRVCGPTGLNLTADFYDACVFDVVATGNVSFAFVSGSASIESECQDDPSCSGGSGGSSGQAGLSCPNFCSFNGQCDTNTGLCTCNVGYHLPDCDRFNECGDGIILAPEECDDGQSGNSNAADACRPDCTAPRCGDGIIDTAAGEECDDSGASTTCDASCKTIVDDDNDDDDNDDDDDDGPFAAIGGPLVIGIVAAAIIIIAIVFIQQAASSGSYTAPVQSPTSDATKMTPAAKAAAAAEAAKKE